jgi:protein-serine/threonine kinase
VIRFYAAEIVIALQHIHELGIVYRDLKPENVLVDAEGHIKLTDFGLSKSNPNSEDLTFTVCGTPEYIAPEVIKNRGHNKNIDYWSLGILLFELYTSQTPFHSASIQDIFKTLKSDAPMDLSQLINASENFISLVSMLLEKDENFRLGTNDPADVMNHPFFSDVDWNEAANKTMQPPFLPPLKSPDDTRMFDTFYLSQPVNESFAVTSSSTTSVHFPAFEFNRSADKATSGSLNSKPLSYKSSSNGSANTIKQNLNSSESKHITETTSSNRSDNKL